jgi:RHS repeat-associated protein
LAASRTRLPSVPAATCPALETMVGRTYRTYKLDKIIDTHGNQVEIVYDVHTMEVSDRVNLRESYPAHIHYTKNETLDPATGNPLDTHFEYDIEFIVSEKDFDVRQYKQLSETGYKLDTIQVWYKANSTATKKLIRQYTFDYDVVAEEHYRLSSITQCADEQCNEALPSTTFTYYYDTDHRIGWRDGSGPLSAKRPFLQTVDNGYGGELTFDYEPWCQPYQDKPCTEDWLIKRQRVEDKALSAGVGPSMTYGYTYANPDIEYEEENVKTFIGFEWITETTSAAGDRQTVSRFQTTGGDPEDPYKGKILQTAVEDLNGKLYTRTTTTYTDTREASWPDSVHFVYPSEVVEETCAGEGSCQGTRTTYEYNRQWQSCLTTDPQSQKQYGNVTHVREYVSESPSTPYTAYRTTITGYCPNTDAWIVDKPAFVNVRAGESGDFASSTWYIYDDNSTAYWGNPVGDQGELQGVRRMQELGSTQPSSFADTRYSYDDWGNVTEQKVYTGYGDDSNWASGGEQVTTTKYDTTHHTFPIVITNTLAQTTTTEYYGVDGVTADEGLPGQVKKVTDANGGLTQYRYDEFGRLVKVLQPGDNDWVDPTQQFDYYEGDSVNWGTGPQALVSVSQKVAPASPKLWTRKLYDGLGRLVQTQSAAEDWVNVGSGETSGHDIVQYTTYDALGQVAKQSLPYEVDSYDAVGTPLPTPYQVPGSEAGTTYTYDTLGRVKVVTNPDLTTIRHYYSYWIESVYNERGAAHKYEKDAFGRLIEVTEYNVTEPVSTTTPYATTSYEYDELGNLVAVFDATAHDAQGDLVVDPPYTTTMTYDMLGRKTGMHDPDMGDWDYRYDAAGNLTVQDDAKHQRLCFYYDALNRLEGKYYTTDTVDCPLNPTYTTYTVSYYYDGDTCGDCSTPTGKVVGQRTAMDDDSGWTVYSFDDARGRLTEEQKYINGNDEGTLVMQWTYDDADRVETTTYPDSEVVTTTYNIQGLPGTLNGRSAYGSSAYVGRTDYNAQGQLTLLDFGAEYGAQTTYTYYGDPGATPPGDYENVPSSRLMEINTVDSNGTVVQRLRYGYDAAGNVQDWWDDGGGTTADGPTEPQLWTFTYDPLDRLTEMNGAEWQGYAYDPIGNIITHTANGGYYYEDPAHEHAVTGTSIGGSFSYDENGNMTSRLLEEAGTTYTQQWDRENRLASVTDGTTGEVTTFTYDGDGALVKAADSCQVTYYMGDTYELQVDTTTPVDLPEADLETLDNWDLVASPVWPATSFFTETWGTSLGRNDSAGVAISNQAFGYIYSDPIAADPNTPYHLQAWIRGELDADDSWGCWTLRLYFYQGTAYLDEAVAATGCGGLAETVWQPISGTVTTVTNTTQVKAVFYAFMNSGWVAVDDFILKKNGVGSNLVNNFSFENPGNWLFEAKEEFPGTSIWRGRTDIAQGRGGTGTYAVAISNLGHGYLRSTHGLAVDQDATAYRLQAQVKGEMDGEDGWGCWTMRMYFYDSAGENLGFVAVPDDCSELSADWQQKGGSITPLAGSDTMRIHLGQFRNSGWVAFDDVKLDKMVNGEWVPVVVPNAGFEEDTTAWQQWVAAPFPATSFWLGDWGPALPYEGERAAVISNHAYGRIESDPVEVTGGRCYVLGAWLHGEIDPEDSFLGWLLRAEFLNGTQSVGWEDAVAARQVNPDWTYVEGRVTAPAEATALQVQLYSLLSSGWVTFDDVSLRACGESSSEALAASPPSSPATGNASPPLAPEEQALAARPQVELDYSADCEDEDACLAVGTPQPVTGTIPVQWAAMTELDEERVREMMGQATGQAESMVPAGAAALELDNTVVVIKRYVFGGQVVAMRRDETLYFLRPDHLGSASLTLDANGNWLADQRFYPYGEMKRSEGASPSYPNDRLFTGMALYDKIGLYHMGARWYGSSLNQLVQPDTIIPDPVNPQSFNRYLYSLGNPLRYLDPSGHYTVEFDSQEAQDAFDEMGWNSPEEFIDWLLGLLESAAMSDPSGELAWFMPYFRNFDQDSPVNFVFRTGGALQGGQGSLLGDKGFVNLDATGIVNKQQATDTASDFYNSNVLPYATLMAHELYHAVAEPYGYPGTLAGEQDAYRFQLKAAQEMGLQWGEDSVVGQLAGSRSELAKYGYFSPKAELKWCLTVAFYSLGGSVFVRDQHDMLYLYSPTYQYP